MLPVSTCGSCLPACQINVPLPPRAQCWAATGPADPAGALLVVAENGPARPVGAGLVLPEITGQLTLWVQGWQGRPADPWVQGWFGIDQLTLRVQG